MAYRLTLCVGIVFAIVVGVQGQVPRGKPVPRVIEFVPMDLEGRVLEVRPGMLAVAVPGKGAWRLGVSETTNISVAGKALPDVLRPGLFIRFVGTVDKQQGRVTDKVGKLTIFTPSKDDARTLGVFLPGQCRPVVSFLEEAAAAAAGNAAAAPPKADGAAAASSPANEQGAGESLPPAAKDAHEIHAQITGGKGNRLTLKVPNKLFKPTLKIELAAAPTIDLDLADYTLARPGDKVMARGAQLGPNHLQATELLITLTETQGHAKKKR